MGDRRRGTGVAIVSLEGGDSETIDLRAGEGDPAGFETSHSPDGRFFAYATAFGRNSVLSEIWIADAKGGGARRVAGGGSFSISPSWSRDGRRLLFVSNRGGGTDVWQQRLSKDAEPIGGPVAVTTGLEGWYATLSRDGTKLAVAKRRNISSLWRMPVGGDRPAGWGDAVQLTYQQGQITRARPFPDGGGVLLSMRSVDGHFLWPKGDVADLLGVERVGNVAVTGLEAFHEPAGIESWDIGPAACADDHLTSPEPVLLSSPKPSRIMISASSPW